MRLRIPFDKWFKYCLVRFITMSANSRSSKFIEYLDSFHGKELGFYETYTLFNAINHDYSSNEYGCENYVGKKYLTHSRKSRLVSVPPPMNPSPLEIVEKTIEVGHIKTIDDIIDLIDKNPYEEGVQYNIDLGIVSTIRPELAKIQSMIGMNKLKCNVVEQLLYFMQGFHEGVSPYSSGGGGGDFTKGITPSSGGGGGDFKHTVIYGPPGTGKTEVAKLIGQMYGKIGVLSKNHIFKKVTRNDLVAGYLGQTAIKTKAVITECLGGVLFIDEVYALGNGDDLDSFSRECIDTLCEALSDHKDDLMVIIAGYEKEIDRNFFSANPGLESRFVWRFAIDKYTPAEMRDIFVKKVLTAGWNIDKEIANSEWFVKHKDVFTNYGRDMERLFLYVKIAHSRRVFGKPTEMKRVLTEPDMTSGLETFLENRKKDDSLKLKRDILTSMYV